MAFKLKYSVFLLLVSVFSFSQEKYSLTKLYFKDTLCSLNITDLEKCVFSEKPDTTNSSCNWIKLKITNKSSDDKICITTQQLLSNVIIYKNSELPYDLGYNVPINKRDLCFNTNYAELPLNPNDTGVFFVKLPDSVSDIDFVCVSKQELLKQISSKDKIQLFFSGIFIVMFLYNLFVFFSIREKAHLYYSLTIILSLLLWINNTGFLSRFLYPDINISLDFKIGLIASAAYGTLFILFTQSFLKLKVLFPKWNIYLIILMVLILSVPVIQVITGINPIAFGAPSFLSGLILFISVLILSIYALIKKLKEVRFFFIGNALFFGFAIYFFMGVFNSVPQNQFWFFSMETGTVLQIILFSFALADKINILKSENERVNQQVIFQLKENDKIKSDINIRLEKEVKERTFEIETQKNKLEEKQSEIIESITYAKRIQEAILPPTELLDKLFRENYFVFYVPKDIVSGDFYWAAEVKNTSISSINLSFAAVVDCTGHGVPGAFMSIVGTNALKQSLIDPTINSTAEVLDFLNTSTINALNQSHSEASVVRDGMDISIISIDYENKRLNYSGANNSIYIIRDNELTILKADKQAIGLVGDTIKKYTNHFFDLQKGDCIYLFSDGYADQFGGNRGKKLTYKLFKELLVEASSLDIKEQKAFIQIRFEAWKSDFEQLDDVCVMGIKI